MLLNIAKAFEMLQFSKRKADAHNEVISVLLRHAQRLGQISVLVVIT